MLPKHVRNNVQITQNLYFSFLFFLNVPIKGAESIITYEKFQLAIVEYVAKIEGLIDILPNTSLIRVFFFSCNFFFYLRTIFNEVIDRNYLLLDSLKTIKLIPLMCTFNNNFHKLYNFTKKYKITNLFRQ